MILLDTLALLWWALDPEKLSLAAKQACEQMEEGGGFASSISLWEIGVKAQRGKLELGIGIDEFAGRLEQTGVIEFLPVDAPTWLRSLALPWPHRDPADRVIVATALQKGLPVLTKDAAIQGFGQVRCVW